MKHLLSFCLAALFILSSCNEQKNDRKLAEQLNNEAIEQLQKNNTEAAVKLLNSAIEADQTYAEPHAYLIQINLQEADFDAALNQTKIVIEKSPSEAENWVLAGILTEKKGNKEEALTYYKESIKWFESRLEEQKANNKETESNSNLPLQDEVNIIFSYILLEQHNEANKRIEDLENRFPNNAMIQNLYDFDKEMYLDNLFPEMETEE